MLLQTLSKQNNDSNAATIAALPAKLVLLTAGIVCALAAVFSAACTGTGSFTRATASRAIAENKNFRVPAVMESDTSLLYNMRINFPQDSPEETVEQANERGRETFCQSHPRICVAERLQFVALKLPQAELYTEFRRNKWRYELVKTEQTEAGKKLWAEFNTADQYRLPIASREVIEITGINEEDKNNFRVEFTYKWKPNALGAAFDPKESAFGKLPEDLQYKLQNIPREFNRVASPGVADWATPRQGVARFRRYDDGWRLMEIFL